MKAFLDVKCIKPEQLTMILKRHEHFFFFAANIYYFYE